MTGHAEPVRCRSDARRRKTVFADTDSIGAVVAEILGGAQVTVAQTLDEALESDAEVLVLSVDELRSYGLSPAQIQGLRSRKLLVTGENADQLCRELDLDIGGGMAWDMERLVVLDTALLPLEEDACRRIEPLFERPVPQSFELGQDPRHLAWRHVHHELRMVDGKGFIEVLVALPQNDGWGVVMRQANCVFAGVVAPPTDWSADYRRLFRAVADALAERDLEEFKPAVVPRQIHPPGVVRFELGPRDADSASNRREFHFQFDCPTVFTATLRHSGSDAAMLSFQGGPKQRLFTREDAECGETLTVAITLGQSSIDAIEGRYWIVGVTNFDHLNRMSAELTVHYDSVEGGTTRSLPSDASFEQFHWFAERLKIEDPKLRHRATARRRRTARAFGFDDWETLRDHVAWREPKPPKDGAQMRDIYFRQAQARFGESFGLAELSTIHAALQIQDDLHHAIAEAFAIAETHRHAAVGVEHLLTALLDEQATRDALSKCGADLPVLRSDLVRSLASVGSGTGAKTSRELFGVLVRSRLHPALGREGANAANALVGIFAESCAAKTLLERQGLRRHDVIRYLAHGIPKSLGDGPRTTGALSASVENVLYGEYARAETGRHEAFGVEHLLLGLTRAPASVVRVASGSGHHALRAELDAFTASMPTASGQPRATRALNRVMQQAVARARRAGDAPAGFEYVFRAIATERNTFAADVLARYGVSLS